MIETEPMIETDRLILRRWREEDLAPFAAMNADPEVMEFFASTLTREESDALAERADGRFDAVGYGLFAVEVRDGAGFVGFVGLNPLAGDGLPVEGDAEVGWRLARPAWGRGYATEAALASLRFGFQDRCLDRIVSFTSVPNVRSQRVMERIGLRRDPSGDFEHPRLPPGHALRTQVLYRLAAADWAEREGRDSGAGSS